MKEVVMRLLAPAFAMLAGCLATAALADDYDWHSKSNRLQMATIFEATGKVCSAMFGFTALPLQPKEAMAEKIDAYLLLRDNPDAELESWLSIFKPPIDVAAGKPSEPDDYRGGAALVAAAKDPSLMEEAKERYVEAAMAPFRRALDACSAGVQDPFLGKYYWTGTGSAADIEKSFSDDFAEAVAETAQRPKRK
jgi:hypothetical protein